MSQSTTTTTQTNNQLTIDYTLKNILRGANYFDEGQVTASGSDISLVLGMVMGRVKATGKMIPWDKDATDGSQYPVGLCYLGINETATVTDGTSSYINVISKGRVDAGLINFASEETLETVVNNRQVRDWLTDLGLTLEYPEERKEFA